MKKIILMLTLILNGVSWGQVDTINYDNEIDATNHIYGLLDTNIYGHSLLNRSISTGQTVLQQIRGQYNHKMTINEWADILNAVSLSYINHNRVKTIPDYAYLINDKFEDYQLNYEGLVQPFSLIINQSQLIDTNLLNAQENFENINGQLNPLIDEALIYDTVVLKAAALLEFYPDNGYETGKIIYDTNFIITGENIEIIEIKINLNDGNGYQLFDENNNILEYDRSVDSLLANASITYTLDNKLQHSRIDFYLTTQSYLTDNFNTYKGIGNNKWDSTITLVFLPDIYEIKVSVKFGCDNNHKIRRPIIVAPPYRPLIQPFSMNKYYKQFNISNFIDSCNYLGYDVIWVKELPGIRSLELAGHYFAELIKIINNKKQINYPYEDWETIVMGYSKGGQVARYALKRLEKEHMEHNKPHPHTRLYIPFDSPHHGANIPLFAQAVYKEFRFTNIFAMLAWISLVDEASTDMGGYTITASTPLPGGGNNSGYTPHPHQNAVDYQNTIKNDFNHYYTNLNDTRKSFPAFSRNIAISTGSYKDNYSSYWGLSPGLQLFSQSTLTYNPLTLSWGLAQRQIFASSYSTTTAKTVFKRNDWYFAIIIPYTVNKTYKFIDAYEWDMAQGGYKNNFYDNVGGPIPILRMSTFGIGTKYYDKKVSFLPLVSALGINPTIWQNNNLYYNLQDEMMFYIDGNSQTGYVTSYNHGYPHLGHPNNHFHITPFEALYADEHTYDHIVMKKTVEEFDNTTEADLDRLRAFLISEIESFNFYLQNKIIGKNHVINSNYEYKAWYKASGTMFIGHNVTPKTNPGDYIIEPTGNITVYANNAVVIKPGFHAENGSTFHAFINGPPICDDSNRDKQTNNEQNQKEIVNKSFTIIQENYVNLDEAKLYPNPNTGQFIFEVNLINKKHNQLIIYTLTGQQVYAQQITKNKTLLNLNLDKGVYLVVYNNGEYNQNTKMIVQ